MSTSIKSLICSLLAFLSFYLFWSCSESSKVSAEATIPGLYAFNCNSSVGLCVLDITFNSDKTGESTETHYDSKDDIISVRKRTFTWQQKGDKAYLTGVSSTAYRDGSSSTNNNWSGEFDYVDGYWVPGTGFLSGFKENFFNKQQSKLDAEHVKECVSWERYYDDENCFWVIDITNTLGKYYSDSDYKFGSIEYEKTEPTYWNNVSESFTMRLRPVWLYVRLDICKNNPTALENVKKNYLEKVKSGKSYGYLVLQLNGKIYTLDEF